MTEFAKTDRNRVKRGHNRARYDEETIHAILDSHFLCHVAYEVAGQPQIIPTSYWREGNCLYWHGASKSRMIREVTSGKEACVSVTHLDGLVLARSAFNTSANYRSAICYGRPELVTDEAEFDRQMILFFEQLAPGRWSQLRPITAQERKATALVVMEIVDAAAKVRDGGPGDDEEADWPVWSGHIPLAMQQRGPVGATEGVKAPLNHGLMPDYDWNQNR